MIRDTRLIIVPLVVTEEKNTIVSLYLFPYRARASKHFYGKEPRPLLCSGWRATLGKIAIIGISDRLNYCAIFILYS